MLATAENLRGHYWLATALWLNEMASAYAGDWQAARGFNQRGLMVSPSDTRLIGTRMVLEFNREIPTQNLAEPSDNRSSTTGQINDAQALLYSLRPPQVPLVHP